MKELDFRDDKYNTRLSIAVLMPYVILTLEVLFGSVVDSSILQIVGKCIMGIYFAYIFIRYFNRIIIKFSTLFVLFFAIFALNILLYSDRTNVIINIFSYFAVICLPIYVYSNSISDMNIFRKCSDVISYVLIFIGLLILISRINVITTYNMSLGYYLLFPCVNTLSNVLEGKRILINAMAFGIAFITIFLFASRGPILCVCIFVILYELSNIDFGKYSAKKIILQMCCIVLLIGIVFNYKTIMDFIIARLHTLGLQSRSLEMLLNGDISDLSNRDSLYAWAYQEINDAFFSGHGIGYSIMSKGTYCHNIILEFAIEIGFIGAICIVIFLFLSFLYRIRFSNSNMKKLTLIWFSVGVIPLMFSGIYWQFMQFWCYLGLTIHVSGRITIKRKV